MMTLENRRYFRCSLEERLSCVPLVEEMVDLAKTARSRGLLALEEKVAKSGDDFLRSGVALVVDGNDPGTVGSMMTTRAVASHNVGVSLLRKAIIIEGLLAIQAGYNPLTVEEKLHYYLGEDVIAIVKNKHAPSIASGGGDMSELERAAGRFGEIFKAMRAAEEATDFTRITDETLANLFLFIEPETSAKIVSSLPVERQANIIKLLDCDDRQDINIAYELKDMLDENLVFGQVKKMSHTKRVTLIADIMKFTTRKAERDIMTRLEAEAADLAEEIRRQMFVFDDIAILGDNAIQRLLRDISDDDLALALKSAAEETRGLFFGNMSSRMAGIVKDNMASLPARPEDIEGAQQRIINSVRKLEGAGEIVILRSK